MHQSGGRQKQADVAFGPAM